MQLSAVSPTISSRNGVMSRSIFVIIMDEKTIISDITSIVMHIVMFCFRLEHVVFKASAICRGALVRSSGIWFCLKLCVCMPWRSAVIGSICLIRCADAHTASATVPPEMASVMKNGRAKKCMAYGIPVWEIIIVFTVGNTQ